MSISLYLSKVFIPFYVIFLLGALSLSIHSYQRIRDELSRLWFTLFIVLRTFLFFLIFSALFSLILQLRFSKSEKPEVFVLIDYSGSMNAKTDGISRKKQAIRLAQDKIFPALQKKAETKLLLFSDTVYELQDSANVNKSMTMIGNSVKSLSKFSKTTPSAIFLLSDGRNTSGIEPAEIAEKVTYPIFTVPVGTFNKENNISISQITINPIVYKGDSVPATILITNNGITRKNLKVQIRREGKVLSKKNISLLEHGIDYPVRLYIVPDKEGIINYEATLSIFDDETNKEDNRKSFAIRVKRKRKIVIAIAYELNWDYRFLRDFLMHQKDTEFTGYARLNNNQFLIQTDKKESTGQIDLNRLKSADVVILINPEKIKTTLVSFISRRVSKNGMGLLIIGNKLPNLSEFRNMYPFIISGNTLTGDVEPTVTQTGYNSPLFKVNEITVSSLPPLSNPLRVKAAKALTRIYLQGSLHGSQHIPLFGSVNYGKGKVAAFTAENLWYWKMLPLTTKSETPIYDNIISNILRFITVMNEEKKLVLYAPKTKLLWGEPLTVNATLYDEMMNALMGGIIELHIEKDGKKLNDFIMNDIGDGNYKQTINLPKPGRYTVSAEAKSPISARSKETLHLYVEPQEIENLNTEPNTLLLENIADASSGRIIEPHRLQNDLTSLSFKPRILSHRLKFNFSNSLVILLIIIAIFLLELFLRKLKQLK